MALIQIDDVDIQALQRSIKLLLDLGCRETIIGLVADGEIKLGCDEITVPRIGAQGFAEILLGVARSVLIRSIEESNAVIDRGVDAAECLIERDATGNSEPGTKAQLRNF